MITPFKPGATIVKGDLCQKAVLGMFMKENLRRILFLNKTLFCEQQSNAVFSSTTFRRVIGNQNPTTLTSSDEFPRHSVFVGATAFLSVVLRSVAFCQSKCDGQRSFPFAKGNRIFTFSSPKKRVFENLAASLHSFPVPNGRFLSSCESEFLSLYACKNITPPSASANPSNFLTLRTSSLCLVTDKDGLFWEASPLCFHP